MRLIAALAASTVFLAGCGGIGAPEEEESRAEASQDGRAEADADEEEDSAGEEGEEG